MSVVITIIMFCLAIVISATSGWFARIWLGLPSELEKTLTAELEAVKNELKHYQSNVNTHFEKTADLFNGILEQSKIFHDYLLTSAKELCYPDATIHSAAERSEKAETSVQEIIIKSCANKDYNNPNNTLDHNWHPTFFEARDAVIDSKLSYFNNPNNDMDHSITIDSIESLDSENNLKKSGAAHEN